MGKVAYSIPRGLVAILSNNLKIDNFVETTSFLDQETVEWASNLFPKTYVLGSKGKDSGKVFFKEGEASSLLESALGTEIKGASVFYLNAHTEKMSRLREELAVLRKIEKPILFINNVHYLYANSPHVAQKDYPTFDEIFRLLNQYFPESFTTVVDGVLVSVPQELQGTVSSFWSKTYEERFYVPDEAPKQRTFLEKVMSKSRKMMHSKKKEVGVSVAYDIHNDWFDGQIQEFHESHRWLNDYGFKSIIDVGGNVGQFSKKIRTYYPEAMIYSFEPIPFVYDVLMQNFEGDQKFKGFCSGLGDKPGNSKFYLNDFSDSSSMLKIAEEHVKNFPYTKNETVIEVDIKRLDDCIDVQKIEKPYLLKLDVQGFEDKVIDGGLEIVKNAELIITESSYKELYEGQVFFDVIYDKLIALGFRFAGNLEQMDSVFTGEPLQGDAIFKKVK